MNVHVRCVGSNTDDVMCKLIRRDRTHILQVFETNFEQKLAWEGTLYGVSLAIAMRHLAQPIVGIAFRNPHEVLDHKVDSRLEIALMVRKAQYRALDHDMSLEGHMHVNHVFHRATQWVLRHGDRMYLAPEMKEELWELRHLHL